MKEIIQDNKFVELNYKIINQKNGNILTQVDIPLGYVHGENSQLFERVTEELTGKSVGDKVEVPLDCTDLFGERDESLVFIDSIKNVPEQYHKVGIKITMENSKGEPKDFFVTDITNDTITMDGNNPLCGKKVLFSLEVLSIRDATDEEIAIGGAVEPEIDLNEIVQ